MLPFIQAPNDHSRRHGDTKKSRNFIVHCYDRVDIAILHDITQRRLSDFDRFSEEIQAYCDHHD
jgi:uncharacterized protein YutE (UPF0331/DUF86 family)